MNQSEAAVKPRTRIRRTAPKIRKPPTVQPGFEPVFANRLLFAGAPRHMLFALITRWLCWQHYVERRKRKPQTRH